MSEEGGRQDPINHYGPWAAIAGYALAGGLIWILFAFADQFS
ncbi:MAG: hypothetical protein AAF371_10070 [Pseudomonadota bacterium]